MKCNVCNSFHLIKSHYFRSLAVRPKVNFSLQQGDSAKNRAPTAEPLNQKKAVKDRVSLFISISFVIPSDCL